VDVGLSADEIRLDGEGSIGFTEDCINSDVSVRTIIKNFNLSLRISDKIGLIAEFESLNISGDFSVVYDSGKVVPGITINASGYMNVNAIHFTLYVDSMDLFLSLRAKSIELSVGGAIVVEGKNISFISSSDTDLVVDHVSIDFLYPGMGMLLIIENANISFTGISSVDIKFVDDGILVTVDVEDGAVEIRTLWMYVGMDVRFTSVLILGSTTFNIDLREGMVVTIDATYVIQVGEFLVSETAYLYGIEGHGNASLGFDNSGSFIIGAGGSWHIDSISIPLAGMTVNDINLNGGAYLVMGFFLGTDMVVHMKAVAYKTTTVSLVISGSIPITATLHPGVVILDASTQTIGDYTHVEIFASSTSAITLDIESAIVSRFMPIEIPYGGTFELCGDIQQIELNPINVVLDIDEISVSGEVTFKGPIFGQEWSIAGRGTIHNLVVDMNKDRDGQISFTSDGVITFTIASVVKMKLYDVNVNIEWDFNSIIGELEAILYSYIYGDFDLCVWWGGGWVQIWSNWPGHTPENMGVVTLVTNTGFMINIASIEIIPGDTVSFTAWYGLAEGSNGPYEFEFNYGDGSPHEIINVPYSTTPIQINTEHMYTEPGTYIASVTVDDYDADGPAVDTIPVYVVEKYLRVSSVNTHFDYEDVDSEGKLHGSFIVKNIANEIYSHGYILDWELVDTTNPGWGTDWIFEPLSGELGPGESTVVNFSFRPPEIEGDYMGASIQVRNIHDPSEYRGVSFSVVYGLVELLPDYPVTLLIDLSSGSIKTFYDVLWVYSNRWETLEWEVDETYSSSHSEFDFTCDPNEGITYPGDLLDHIDLTIIAPSAVGTYTGEIKVQRVGYPNDNDTVRINLVVVNSNEEPKAYVYAWRQGPLGVWYYEGGTYPGGDGTTIPGSTDGMYAFTAYAPNAGLYGLIYAGYPDTRDPDGTITKYRWQVDTLDTGWKNTVGGTIPDTEDEFGLVTFGTTGLKTVRLSVRDNKGAEKTAYLYMNIGGSGSGWVTPDGHEATGEWWYPERAYDDVLSSAAHYSQMHGYQSQPLILEMDSPITCDGFRINAKSGDHLTTMLVDLYEPGHSWYTVRKIFYSWPDQGWKECQLGSSYSNIDRAKISFILEDGYWFSGHWACVYEFDFHVPP